MAASTRIGQGPSTPVIKLQPAIGIAHIPAAIITFGQQLTVAWRVDVRLACLYVGQPKPTAEWRALLDSGVRTSASAATSPTKLSAATTTTTTVQQPQPQQQQPPSSASLQQLQHQPGGAAPTTPRLEVGTDNTLTLRNVQRSHQGNYTCAVRQTATAGGGGGGTDHIVYQLLVQVPPDAPELRVAATAASAVTLEWRAGATGGAPLHGFVLAVRREFGEWREQQLDRHTGTFQLEALQCGTRYQLSLAGFNRIGRGAASRVEQTRTRGDKPIAPQRQHLIRANVTGIALELGAWQDGGCAIGYFTVEFRRSATAAVGGGRQQKLQQQQQMQAESATGGALAASGDWIVVSSNVPPQTRFAIPDLEPATGYQLRLTAYNNAGPTIAEYYFETLPVGGFAAGAGGVGGGSNGGAGGGSMMGGGGADGGAGQMGGGGMGGAGRVTGMDGGEVDGAEPVRLFGDVYLVGVSVLAVFSVCLAVMGVCFCLYSREYIYVDIWLIV